MSEEGLMSQKDFSYHLSTFMDYMRRMEKGMSDQWDNIEKFQLEVKENSQNIINELSKNEKLTDVGALVKGLKTQFNHQLAGVQQHITALKEGREDLQNIRRDIEMTHTEAIQEMRELIKEFKIVTPEELVKRGALQALEMVAEFKEAYEYIKKVRGALESGELPSFEFIPYGISGLIWNKPIDELELSVRATNVLQAMDVKVLGDLVSLNRADLLRNRTLGKKTLNEIENVLKHHGLKLGMTKN